jgi:hypothetical protein
MWGFGRALRASSRAALAVWVLSSALALFTHYFAVFLVVPQAAVLVRRREPGRGSLLAVAGVAAAAAAALPLALHQASFGHARWIANSSFAGRMAALPGDLTVGFDAQPRILLCVVSAVAIGIACRLVRVRARGADRSGAATCGALAAAAIALPVGLAGLGVDYVSGRNLLAVTVPLAIVLGTACAVAGRVGRVGIAALVTLSLGLAVVGSEQPKFHSEDWRGAVEDLGGVAEPRAIVATPGQAGRKELEYYVGASPPARRQLVHEVDVLVLPHQGDSRVAPADLSRLLRLRLPGFTRKRARLERGFALLTYRATRRQPVSGATLDARVQRGARTVVVHPRSYTRSPAARLASSSTD